ncbi:MAG: protein kinase [Acidobacteriota bacterium]
MAAGTGLVGTTLQQYKVVDRLGSGGMGEVYLAEDTRLGRRVALKFIGTAESGDPDARTRLVREARAAAVLRSPHIAVTYDLGEHDGRLFIAMEYVEGELLSARIARGPLPVPDGLDVAMQVADALDEAHSHGIVHRDIKSANLIVTPRQLVKVLDFGLARLTSGPSPAEVHTMAGLTAPGLVLGTLSYMAPEQLRGQPADHRADLFALGVVLYEMLAARLPFAADTMPDIADRILNHEPDAIARWNYGVPAEVETILRKALEKRADFRYQSARELYVDLFNARRRLSGAESSHRGSAVWRGPIDFTDPASPLPARPPLGAAASAAAGQHGLAVLTFANITRDPADEWIGLGIAETLTADLRHVRNLTVIPREQIFDQLRNVAASAAGLDERQAIDIGRRVGAWWVLTGGYQHLGSRLRVTANLVEVAVGRLVTTVKLDGAVEELFDLQDSLVKQVAAALQLGVDSAIAGREPRAEPASLEAYEAYSRGMLNLRMAGRESFERAISLFERAIQLDGSYAEAYAGLGAALQLKASFLSLPDLNEKSIAMLHKALAIKPTLVEAQVRLGQSLVTRHDTDEGVRLLEDAVRREPRSAQAHGTLGRAYWLGQGRVDAAIRELETAVALNPESGYAHLQLALLYAMSGRLDEAGRAAQAAVALQEQAMSGTQGLLVVGAHTRLGYVHYLAGRYDEALAEYRRELEFLSATDHVLRERTLIEINQKLGAAHLRRGDANAAEQHFARAQSAFEARLAAGSDDASTRYYIATLAALRGDAVEAARHLDRPLRELPALTRWRIARDPDFQSVLDRSPLKELLA